MKRISLFLTAALMVAAVSCTKEQVAEYGSEKVTLEVGLDSSTRTHLGTGEQALQILWSEGDEVGFLDAANKFQKKTVDSKYVGTSQAHFSFEEAPELPVKIYYPGATGSYAGEIHVDEVQKYVAGSFANNRSMLYGVCSDFGTPATLASLSSYIALSFEDDVIAVAIVAKGGEQLSGNFAVSDSGLKPRGGSAAIYVTDIPDYTKSFILAVPAGYLSAGFQVRAQFGMTGSDIWYSKDAYSSSTTLKPGVKLVMPEIKTDSMQEISSTLIRTASDLRNYISCPSENAKLACSIDMTGIAVIPGETLDYEFDGGGFTVSGLSTSQPLFGAIGTSGSVRNVVLDGTTCTITDPTEEVKFGLLAGECSGKVNGVVVKNAKYAVQDTDGTNNILYVGGLVGNVKAGGSISHCSTAGAMTVTIGANSTLTTSVGGMAGNLDGTSESKRIYECTNSCSISFKYTGAATKNTRIGGILGSGTPYYDGTGTYPSYGVIDGCVNTGDVTVEYPTGAGAYFSVGGIVGFWQGDITNCDNRGCVDFDTSVTVGTPSPRVGGIAGIVVGKVQKDNNYGVVTVDGWFGNAGANTNPEIAHTISTHVGGCFGQVGDSTLTTTDVIMNECRNYADCLLNPCMKPSNSSSHYIGLVAGACYGSAMSCSNYSTKSKMTTTVAKAYIGGVIGAAAGNVIECYNEGKLYASVDVSTSTAAKTRLAYVGGVLGYLSTASNVDNCVNNGEMEVVYASTGALAKKAGALQTYTAGVLAMAVPKGSIISCCHNNAKVYAHGVTCPDVFSYVGGVLGTYDTGGNNMDSCSNMADVTGELSGKTRVAGLAASHNGRISDCSSKGNVTMRGANGTAASYAGGLAGYLRSTEISNVSCSGTVTIDGCTADSYAGGMVGLSHTGEITYVGAELDVQVSNVNTTAAEPEKMIGLVTGSFSSNATASGYSYPAVLHFGTAEVPAKVYSTSSVQGVIVTDLNMAQLYAPATITAGEAGNEGSIDVTNASIQTK